MCGRRGIARVEAAPAKGVSRLSGEPLDIVNDTCCLLNCFHFFTEGFAEKKLICFVFIFAQFFELISKERLDFVFPLFI